MLKLKSLLLYRFTGAAAIFCALAAGSPAQWGVDFPSLQEPEATPSVTAGPVAQTVSNSESKSEASDSFQLPNLDVSAIGIEDQSASNQPIATDPASIKSELEEPIVAKSVDSSTQAPELELPVEVSEVSDPAPSALSEVDPAAIEESEPAVEVQHETEVPVSASTPDVQPKEQDSILSQPTATENITVSPTLFPANNTDPLPDTTVDLPSAPTQQPELAGVASDSSVQAPIASGAEYSDLAARIQSLEDQLTKQKADAAAKKKKDSYKPSVKVGGRLHTDSCWFNQNDASAARAGNCENGSELRRARIGVQGEYMEQFRYKMDFEFATGADVACKDAYAEIIKLPVVSDFRLGYFKESISMEQLTSSNDTWFIERPVCNTGMTSYVMDRSLGMSLGNASQKENYLWNIGIYQPAEDVGTEYRNDNDGWGVTMRLATLLMDDPCNGGNLHVGLGYSYRSWDETKTMNWGTRVESNLSKKVIQTGNFLGTDASHMLAPELMYSFGPFAVQAEYYLAALQNDAYDNPEFTGGYVQVGYWLTGEHYNYEKGKGVLGRVKPCRSFFRMCDGNNFLWGPGAWQVVYRFSWLDLSDLNLQAGANPNTSEIGTVYDHTFGLNWQLNNNTRFMFNYVNSTDSYTYGALNRKGYVDVFSAAFQLVY